MDETEIEKLMEKFCKRCVKCNHRIGKLAQYCPMCRHPFPMFKLTPTQRKEAREWGELIGCTPIGHLLQRLAAPHIFCVRCGKSLVDDFGTTLN